MISATTLKIPEPQRLVPTDLASREPFHHYRGQAENGEIKHSVNSDARPAGCVFLVRGF